MVFSTGISSGGGGGFGGFSVTSDPFGGFNSAFNRQIQDQIRLATPVAPPPVIAAPPPPPPVAPPPVVAAPPAPPPIAPPPPIIAAPPPVVEAPIAPPPVAPIDPVAVPPVVETPVAPAPPIAQADLVAPADPVLVASNPPVATDTTPVDAGTLPSDPFNPATDSGNQDAQASAGNDPVMSAAIPAPTNPSDIFNPGAQNPVGQEGGEAPLLLATNLTATEGEAPVAPDSGNSSDPIQSIQQAGQAVTDAGNQASQNVTESVTQANENIQQTLQPEPSTVTNAEFVAQPSDNGVTSKPSDVAPESNPNPQQINPLQELGRAVVEAVPAVGSVVATGEAVAGKTIFGRELSNEERLILVGSAALGSLGPAAREAGAAAGFIRELAPEAAVALRTVVEGAGDLASNPAVQAAEKAAGINFNATRIFNAFAEQDPQTTLERAAASGTISAVGGGAGAINPALAGPGGQFTTGGIGNVVDQAIGRDGADFALPNPTTQEGRVQLATEFAAGGITGPIGGATGDAVKETVGQVADSIPVGQLVGNEAAGQVTGSAAEGTVAFFGNTVTNAVENAVSPPQLDTEGVVNAIQDGVAQFTPNPIPTDTASDAATPASGNVDAPTELQGGVSTEQQRTSNATSDATTPAVSSSAGAPTQFDLASTIQNVNSSPAAQDLASAEGAFNAQLQQGAVDPNSLVAINDAGNRVQEVVNNDPGVQALVNSVVG